MAVTSSCSSSLAAMSVVPCSISEARVATFPFKERMSWPKDRSSVFAVSMA